MAAGVVVLGIVVAIAALRAGAPGTYVRAAQALLGAPTHLPRSLGRIKTDRLDIASSPEAAAALIGRTAAEGAAFRPLFVPDLRGYHLPERLALRAEDVVADVGCGTGALEVELLERDVPFARLYAVEIDDPSLDVLRRILSVGGWPEAGRVVPLLVEPGSTGLEEASIDVMVVDTVQLHQPFDEPDPWAMHPGGPPEQVRVLLASLFRAVRPGGRLHVVENLATEVPPLPDTDAVRVPYESVGFVLERKERVKDEDSGPGGWHFLFRRPADPA